MNTSGSSNTFAALLICAAVFTGCQDMSTAPNFEPQFLIGNSPLAPITLDTSGKLAVLRASATVNKGSAGVTDPDDFLLRSSGEFRRPDGSTVGAVNPKVDPVTRQEDADLREGLSVGIIMDMDIPAPTWDLIKDLDEVNVDLLIELILVTASGAEKVLDSVRLAGIIDPKIGF